MSKASEYAKREPAPTWRSPTHHEVIARVSTDGALLVNTAIKAKDIPDFIKWLQETFLDE